MDSSYLARVALVSLAGCAGEGLCESDALTEALAGAIEGDEILLGECAIAGSFEVPAGAALRGLGADRSRLIGLAGARALTVSSGSTEVSDLGVESRGTAGIVATGLEDVRLERVRVDLARGVGIAAENLDGFVLDDVTVEGPVVSANPSSTDATHGLVLVRVIGAVFTGVSVRGAAEVGVLSVESRLEWTGGEVARNRGLGLVVEDGTADLDQLRLAETFAGTLAFAWNGVFLDGALVETNALAVEESEGFGILHLDAPEANHVALTAAMNSDAAIWVERTGAFDLSGTLEGNGFAGLVAVDSSNLSLHDLEVKSTTMKVRILEALGGPIEVGDGIQLVRSSNQTSIARVTIADSGRVGLLFELGGAALSLGQLADVTITDASMSALGAIAQNGTIPAGWDQGVARSADLTARDQAAGAQPGVGAIGPCERPAETDLGNRGLSVLVP
jgi:hypothetical protein